MELPTVVINCDKEAAFIHSFEISWFQKNHQFETMYVFCKLIKVKILSLVVLMLTFVADAWQS